MAVSTKISTSNKNTRLILKEIEQKATQDNEPLSQQSKSPGEQRIGKTRPEEPDKYAMPEDIGADQLGEEVPILKQIEQEATQDNEPPSQQSKSPGEQRIGKTRPEEPDKYAMPEDIGADQLDEEVGSSEAKAKFIYSNESKIDLIPECRNSKKPDKKDSLLDCQQTKKAEGKDSILDTPQTNKCDSEDPCLDYCDNQFSARETKMEKDHITLDTHDNYINRLIPNTPNILVKEGRLQFSCCPNGSYLSAQLDCKQISARYPDGFSILTNFGSIQISARYPDGSSILAKFGCMQVSVHCLDVPYILENLICMQISVLCPNRPSLLGQMDKHFVALEKRRMKPISFVYVVKESDINGPDNLIKTSQQKCIANVFGDLNLDPSYCTVPVHALPEYIPNDDNQHGNDALVISDHDLFPPLSYQLYNNVDIQGPEGPVQQPLHDVVEVQAGPECPVQQPLPDVVEVQGPESLLQQPQENINSAALVVSNTDPPCLIHNNQPQQPEHLVVENEEAEGPIQQPQDNNATMLVLSEHESYSLIYNQLQQHVVGVHRDLIQQPDQNNDVMLDDVNDGLPPLMFNQPEADGPVEQPEQNNVIMAVADHGQMADQPNGNDPAAMER